MQFKLFAIDKIELVLRLENMPDAIVCHIADFSTSRCTKKHEI